LVDTSISIDERGIEGWFRLLEIEYFKLPAFTVWMQVVPDYSGL
jgi:hypothetical protein